MTARAFTIWSSNSSTTRSTRLRRGMRPGSRFSFIATTRSPWTTTAAVFLSICTRGKDGPRQRSSDRAPLRRKVRQQLLQGVRWTSRCWSLGCQRALTSARTGGQTGWQCLVSDLQEGSTGRAHQATRKDKEDRNQGPLLAGSGCLYQDGFSLRNTRSEDA